MGKTFESSAFKGAAILSAKKYSIFRNMLLTYDKEKPMNVIDSVCENSTSKQHTYSRSINQPYPRKCIYCNHIEQIEVGVSIPENKKPNLISDGVEVDDTPDEIIDTVPSIGPKMPNLKAGILKLNVLGRGHINLEINITSTDQIDAILKSIEVLAKIHLGKTVTAN